MMKLDSNCPPMSVVRERMEYNPGTGEFVALISAGRRRAGDVLGYADRLGYIKLGIHGKWVMAHRLAWRWVYGQWPQGEIDHINGNPSDNRIENLRVATRSQNVMNTRRGNGVCWHKTKKHWQVLIKAGGEPHYIGAFKEREAAEDAAARAIVKLHGEFANVRGASVSQPKPQPQQEAFDV